MRHVLIGANVHGNLLTASSRALLVLASSLASGCNPVGLGFLNPAGPVAASERGLFVNVILLMLAVIVPAFVLTPLVAWRYRFKSRDARYQPTWTFSWLLEIQFVGLDWQWLFIYQDRHIATVNELVFRVDRPIRLLVTSDTVLQSLMIPRLGGQIYAMAGMRTQVNLKSDAPGIFAGENTQFNGKGFQNQKFKVLAVSPDEFTAWVARVQALPTRLDGPGYAGLSQRSGASAPVFFSEVEPGLFNKIIGRYKHRHAAMQAIKPND